MAEDQKKPRRKKKKIIVVTAGEAMTDETKKQEQSEFRKKLENGPWAGMTAGEFTDYLKDHPEARQEFSALLAEQMTPAIEAAMQLEENRQAIINASKAVQNSVQKAARMVAQVQFDISKIAEAVTRSFLNMPAWATPDELDAVLNEIEELEPYLDAELKKVPGYEGKTFMEAMEFLPFKALYFFLDQEAAEGDAMQDQEAPTGTPEEMQTISELLAVRNAARAAAAKAKQQEQEKKQKAVVDPLKLKDEKWLPMYQGPLNNDLMRLSVRDFFSDGKSVAAHYIAPNGKRYSIDQFDQLTGTLSTSTKKLLDVAVLYLSTQNHYGSGRNSINAQVKIPLITYLEKNGHNLTPRIMDNVEDQAKENDRIKTRIKQFKNAIRRDLNDLRLIKWTAEEKRGRNAGDYADLQIISGHRIIKDIIYINFDIDAAWYLVNAHAMWYPTCLLKHDNRKSNPYPIGRKIALHNGMDNNFFSGTDNTLSVNALLNTAPEIPLITELQERGQRNWKDKIKKPLESALNENITVGLIKKWEYRHPKTGQTYTAEEAQALAWESYSALMVDFIMAESPPPEQEERRKKIIEEKRAAEEAGKIPQKKRGRPRKKAQNPKKDM